MRTLLRSLQAFDNSRAQLRALTDLCDTLSMGGDDTMSAAQVPT
jgi:hypothetical protein